ncbi:Hint domain-containing protein [Pseudooceanicola sp. MF1-13]|uniref:Hint domain-containing protein n=1 Tax=Pseudooceanicola sp. MF1-13 TaxID=3379095 RepID=UPI0038912225
MIKAKNISVTAEQRKSDLGSANVSGLIEGTKICTARGFERIEDIEVGARVVTYNSGLQTVRAVRRTRVWAKGAGPRSEQPLFVPAGAIGNTQDMVLLPHQTVLVESNAAQAALGDAFVLMMAKDLVGVGGISRITPDMPATVVTLEFDNEEVIFAASGAMCICPAQGDADAREGGREYRTLKSLSDAGLVAAVRTELNGTLAQAA